MARPKWATPDRQAHLVRLFTRSNGFCVFGHKPCPCPEHHYEVFIEGLIADWVAEDRAGMVAEWREEQSQMHRLADRRYPLHGQFSAVAKDIFFDQQPQYYLEGLGVSGLTFTAFVKVRVASSFVHLHVDLGDALKTVSKAKRRKAIRYGKGLPADAQRQLDRLVSLAVKDYLDK